jgi:hypothetical protein
MTRKQSHCIESFNDIYTKMWLSKSQTITQGIWFDNCVYFDAKLDMQSHYIEVVQGYIFMEQKM